MFTFFCRANATDWFSSIHLYYHPLIKFKQTMQSPSANTWKQVLLANPFTEAGNTNLESFSKATLASTSKEARLRVLIEDPFTPMLAVAPVTELIKINFGVSNMGGTRYVTEDKVVGLEELSAVVTPVVFSLEDIESTVNVPIPTKTTLNNAKTVEDLTTMVVGARCIFPILAMFFSHLS